MTYSFNMPTIEGDLGEQHLVFYGFDIPNSKNYYRIGYGTKNAVIYQTDKIPDDGLYIVYDEHDNVVGYIDLLGRFTTEKTMAARKLLDYVLNLDREPFEMDLMGFVKKYTSVDLLPSSLFDNKFFIDKIRNEEKRKIKEMSAKGCFNSFIQKLVYKRFVNKVINNKIKKCKLTKLREFDSNTSIDKN